MNNYQPKVNDHITWSDLCQILENLLPNSLLNTPPPNVGSIINSRLPSTTAMVNSSSYELAYCRNSSYRLEPILGDGYNEFLAILNEFPTEVPFAVAGPIPGIPSPVTIVEQIATTAMQYEPEVSLGDLRFELPQVTYRTVDRRTIDLSHLVERGQSAVMPQIPEAPLVIQRYEERNYKMKPQIMISFEDMTKIRNGDYFPATKQPNGPWSCHYCSMTMRNRNDMRRHIRTHTREKLFKCLICENSYTQKGSLKGHMLSVHKYIGNI